MKYKFTKEALRLMQEYQVIREYSPDNIVRDGLDFTPTQGTPNSSGYDLSACIEEELVLLAGEERKIGTGVHIWIGSDEIYNHIEKNIKLGGFLMPRSSIKGCMLTNAVGLCDDDYQGEYIVSLWNKTDSAIVIKPGQKLVQLVYVFTFLPVMELVEDFGVNTIRGSGGFGSTT